jgi:hypothetical protein
MRTLLMGLILAGPAFATLEAQEPETFVRIVPGNRVQLVDAGGRAVREIYRSPAWHASAAELEPGGRRVALLEWNETPASRESELILLQETGRVEARPARNVQRYAWCGTGCLAYITGHYREGRDGFVPDSLHHLDLTTGVRTAIGVPYPLELNWASFDNALYVRTRVLPRGESVMRYDPRTRSLTGTKLKSVRLSPTGRYYIYRPPLTDSLLVLRTADNAEVSLEKFRRGADLIQWADGDSDLLLAVKHEPRPADSGVPRVVADMNPPLTYLLYDVDKGRVVRSQRGRLTTWKSPRNQKLLEANSGLKVLQ